LRRHVLAASPLIVVTALLSGCSGSDDKPSASGTTSGSDRSASASASTAPSPGAALEKGCSHPERDLDFTRGSASLDVTSGPDAGHYDLVLDKSQSNAFAAGDGELTGNWISSDKKAVLFIDVEGGDPCTPEAFTRIGTRGASGPVFIDGGHNQCRISLSSLGADGAQGTFDCIDLTGGGDGLERDAHGTFTLLT
jgi:hypothetical protein